MIISFSGKIGSGKDLSGNICKILLQSPHLNNEGVETFLNKNLYESDGNWEIRKWADKLKDIVCILLGCTREQLEDREFKEKELGPDWEIPLQEEWKAITGYEGLYEISNFGRVKSLNRLDSMGRVVEETIKAQHIGTTGYPTITLNKDGKKKTKVVHQLVAESFLGHIPDSYNGVINHIDNIKTNNRLDNLEVVSSRYNTQYSKSTEGVYERRNKFEVYIRIDGKKTYLGSYTSKEEALKVRNKKLQEVDTFIPLKYVTKQWTPRLLLQNMGTQIGREIIHPDIWVNSLMTEYKSKLSSNHPVDDLDWEPRFIYPNFIITDTRFENELKAVKDREGITIRVNRNPGYKWIDKQEWDLHSKGIVPHESETALDDSTFDYEIDNNGTIPELIDKIRNILIENKLIKNN